MMEDLTKRIEAIVDRLELERIERDGHESSDGDQGDDQLGQLKTVKQVLKSHPFHGIYRKAQLKVTAWGEPEGGGARVPTAAQFILKWGGELTDLGRTQAHNLGSKFRTLLYPGEKDGVLRLHATYRHDLKIYASDEGRVQMSAAAFTKVWRANHVHAHAHARHARARAPLARNLEPNTAEFTHAIPWL